MVPWPVYVDSWRIHIVRFTKSPPALLLSFPLAFICLMVYEYHRSQEQSGCAASWMKSDRGMTKKVKRPRRRRRSTNNGWESNEVQPDVDVKARGFFMEN